jgi:hypothetical protein
MREPGDELWDWMSKELEKCRIAKYTQSEELEDQDIVEAVFACYEAGMSCFVTSARLGISWKEVLDIIDAVTDADIVPAWFDDAERQGD